MLENYSIVLVACLYVYLVISFKINKNPDYTELNKTILRAKLTQQALRRGELT